MTKGTLMSAISMIDERYIGESLSYHEERAKNEVKKRVFRVLIAACAAAMILTATAAPLLRAFFRKAQGGPGADPGTPVAEVIRSGPGVSADNGKPQPSTEIFTNCMSYYANGEKISVDVMLGDRTARSHEQYGVPDGPEFCWVFYAETLLYQADGSTGISDALIFNGESGRYEKRFYPENAVLFDISGHEGETEYYRHETLEIDFSALQEGDCGCIVLVFDKQTAATHNGAADRLYFSVTGDGIQLSFENKWQPEYADEHLYRFIVERFLTELSELNENVAKY